MFLFLGLVLTSWWPPTLFHRTSKPEDDHARFPCPRENVVAADERFRFPYLLSSGCKTSVSKSSVSRREFPNAKVCLPRFEFEICLTAIRKRTIGADSAVKRRRFNKRHSGSTVSAPETNRSILVDCCSQERRLKLNHALIGFRAFAVRVARRKPAWLISLPTCAAEFPIRGVALSSPPNPATAVRRPKDSVLPRQFDCGAPERLRQSRSRLIRAAPLRQLLFEDGNRLWEWIFLASHDAITRSCLHLRYQHRAVGITHG